MGVRLAASHCQRLCGVLWEKWRNNDTARRRKNEESLPDPQGRLPKEVTFTLRTSEFKGGDRVVWEQPRSLGWAGNGQTRYPGGVRSLWACGWHRVDFILSKCSSKDFWQRQGVTSPERNGMPSPETWTLPGRSCGGPSP